MRFQTARWDHGIILLLLLLFIWFFFSFLYFLHLHGWLMAHVIFSQTNTKCYTNAKCLLWIVNFDIFVFSFHIMYNIMNWTPLLELTKWKWKRKRTEKSHLNSNIGTGKAIYTYIQWCSVLIFNIIISRDFNTIWPQLMALCTGCANMCSVVFGLFFFSSLFSFATNITSKATQKWKKKTKQ